MKIGREFFARRADIVAKQLLGKVLVRRIGEKILKSRIVETEAYFGKNDPASRAAKGKNKISELMWSEPGNMLIYNVHMHKMFNFVTGRKDEASAVLLRAIEPLNFPGRTSGPGLLTDALKIDKNLHGELIGKEVWVEDNKEKFEIQKANRIGVTKDLDTPLRFFIKDNEFVSRK